MLNKEFISALIMTVLVAAFTIPMLQLEGESQIAPLLLIVCMGIFNIGQYIIALMRHMSRTDTQMRLKGYPLTRVLVLLSLTVIYLFSLETTGFYPGSLVYLIIATLIAQPMKVTVKKVAMRTLVCSACIAFLYMLFTVLLAVQIPKGFLNV